MIDKTINDDIIELGLSAFLEESSSREFPINRFKNNNLKEHIKSFVITFVVGFAITLVANINDITLATISSGAIFGILFGAIRAGVKGVLELVIAKFS